MSVNVTEMVGQDNIPSSASSKKRKHAAEERAERKKNKKQKHLQVHDSAEFLAGAGGTEATKKTKGRIKSPDEVVHAPGAIQPDIELPDAEGAEAPAIEATPAVPKKKKKRKAIAEVQLTATEQEDIELPDADNETFTSPPPIPETTSPAQQIPPSNSTENTPFHTARTSLYVPVPAISLTTALPSLISTHLTPLLLTYYPPLNGIILTIIDAHISSAASDLPGKPLVLPTITTPSPQGTPTLALCADTSGVSFIWLTFTATTFSPTPSSTLTGHINVTSEGFIGLILHNYFQVGIAKSRIPRSWKWTAPGGSDSRTPSKKQPKKGRIRDAENEENSQVEAEHESGSTVTMIPDSQASNTQDTDIASRKHVEAEAALQQNTGYWTTSSGSILDSNTPLSFRVVDCEIVPSSSRHSDQLALQIEGTLLDEEDENRVLAEERARFERAQNKAYGRTESSGSRGQVNMMSGGFRELTREGSVAAAALRHRVKY
jgi:DNA-directed RNA polymerase I subunit RPA43